MAKRKPSMDYDAAPLGGLLKELRGSEELAATVRALESGAVLDLSAKPAGARALLAAAVAGEAPGRPLIILAPDGERAEELAAGAASFTERVLLLPAWELLPYELHSPDRATTAERLAVLHALAGGFDGLLVATPRSLARRLPSPTELINRFVELTKGGGPAPEDLAQRLTVLGYQRVNLVESPGEFARRGGLFDVYPPGLDGPVRLDYFGDVVEELRCFDPGDQRSREAVESVTLAPLREVLVDETTADRLLDGLPRGELRARLKGLLHREPYFDGVEYFIDRLHPELVDVADYCPRPPLWAFANREACRLAAQRFSAQIAEQYELRDAEPPLLGPRGAEPVGGAHRLERLGAAGDRLRPARDEPEAAVPAPPATPERLFSDLDRFFAAGIVKAPINAVPVPAYHGRLGGLFTDLRRWETAGKRVIICCENRGKLERLGEILAEEELAPPVVLAELAGGAELPERNLILLTDGELFGRTAPLTRRRRRKAPSAGRLAALELKPGDYVVHADHGIGRYVKLTTLRHEGEEADFVELAFRDRAKLFVPIWNLGDLERYDGAGEGRVTLDRLGGTRWKKARGRVKHEVASLAAELIAVHARRDARSGRACPPDGAWQRELEESFPFTDTPDQERATAEVKADLESERPMDRLLCGDVGFGKTEVAVRAAFKVAVDGRQAAVLAPTTILADQHGETFRERTEPFPIEVAVLSRFVPADEQRRILERTAAGEIDILVGTHRLLSRDVRFKELGLLIVDEEQRFGVKHKERLKQLQTDVDVLTMTATPIPRTLYLALMGARDISNIETPPVGRHPIRTYIGETDDALIREAVERELDRGGQVFFVHNRVQSIQEVAGYLGELLPEARLAIAHGRMTPRRLEGVVHEFINHVYDVLVTTTIIENGMDIPNVNTIIINRADRFGLAQLYQLRGRVGRGRHQAYAYLFTPPRRIIGEQAFKRLQALAEFNELGSGFRLAQRDLELRGAGDVLGPSQSGFIEQVGFDLYVRLLREAVAELQGEPLEAREPQTQVKGDFAAFLPDTYVGGPELKIRLYRRLAEVRSLEAARELAAEFRDRFGEPPAAAVNLFTALEVKLLGDTLGVEEVQIGRRRFSLALTNLGRVGRVDLGGCAAVHNPRPRVGAGGRGVIEFSSRGPALAAARDLLAYLVDGLGLVR
jgi:transcription-repair coupling factor (superfamily II helicase)